MVKSAVPTRGQADRPTELEEIAPQITGLKYPIASREDLVKRLEPGHKYFYRGRQITANQMIAKMPATFFPITSEDDYKGKLTAHIKPRPLVKIDPTVPIIKHPTTVRSPSGIKGSKR